MLAGCSPGPGLVPANTQLGVVQRFVIRSAATEKAGEGNDLVDNRQVSVKVNIFFDEFPKLAAVAGQFPLHATDGEVRVKAALLFGIAELRFERLVDFRL